jgi:hypothetical protein
MIVLNGEPFIEYQFAALYPLAARIVVVEGAVRGAGSAATERGHSRDGTLDFIRSFQSSSDPDGKVVLVTGEDEGHLDGFWSEKDEMCRTFAARAAEGWLWQVDSDEFYEPREMRRLLEYLAARDDVQAVSFHYVDFWVGAGYVLDGYAHRLPQYMAHRLFRWRAGFGYASHRPPTVVDSQGRDLRTLGWMSDRETAAFGIQMYHYGMILEQQAERKAAYYAAATWHSYEGARLLRWKTHTWDRLRTPFHMYSLQDHFSWLRRFGGSHPEPAARLLADLASGRWQNCQLRRTDDVEALLASRWFSFALSFVKMITMADVLMSRTATALRAFLIRTGIWPIVSVLRGRS